MINKVTLIGNVGNDPEMKMLEGCTAVARVSLATQDSYKDKAGEWQQQTEWHNVIMWRDLAERAEKQIKKGSKIYVEGKITYRKYKDKDGIDRQVTDIVASTLGIRRYVISHWRTGFRPLAAKWEPIIREWAKTKGMK